MDCLTDYIGLQVCEDADEPESGIFINTLPGISLESVQKIANDDQASYAGVWKDTQKMAQIRFLVAFRAAMAKCYQLNKDCDYEDLICDNKEVLTTAWMYLLGNQIMQYRINTTRLNRFTTIDLEKAKELEVHYIVEFEAALTQSIQLIDVSGCRCKQPGGQISRQWMLP